MLSIQFNSLLLCSLIAVIIGSAYSANSCYFCSPSDNYCVDPLKDHSSTKICGEDASEPCDQNTPNCRLKQIHNIFKQRSDNNTEDLCYSIFIESKHPGDTGTYRGCLSSNSDNPCDLLKEEFKESGPVVNCRTCSGEKDCNHVLENELREGNKSSLFRSSIGIVLLGAFLFSL